MQAMKRTATLLLMALSFGFLLQSCVYEETVVVAPAQPDADVFYDFWAGPRFVEIDGEIFNDGNTFITSVQLEVVTYDDMGFVITRDLMMVDVFLNPREVTGFTLDLPVRYVFDVDVRVRDIFI